MLDRPIQWGFPSPVPGVDIGPKSDEQLRKLVRGGNVLAARLGFINRGLNLSINRTVENSVPLPIQLVDGSPALEEEVHTGGVSAIDCSRKRCSAYVVAGIDVGPLGEQPACDIKL